MLKLLAFSFVCRNWKLYNHTDIYKLETKFFQLINQTFNYSYNLSPYLIKFIQVFSWLSELIFYRQSVIRKSNQSIQKSCKQSWLLQSQVKAASGKLLLEKKNSCSPFNCSQSQNAHIYGRLSKLIPWNIVSQISVY